MAKADVNFASNTKSWDVGGLGVKVMPTRDRPRDTAWSPDDDESS
jgi:hypothetical protein